MLGRKTYTQEELDNATAALARQVAAYQELVDAVAAAPSDPRIAAAVEAFEPMLNEVELLTESLMNNDDVLRGNNVVKFVADQSVTKLVVGDRLQLSDEQFERLAKAFFTDLERKFV